VDFVDKPASARFQREAIAAVDSYFRAAKPDNTKITDADDGF
jgi:hypothetical protein